MIQPCSDNESRKSNPNRRIVTKAVAAVSGAAGVVALIAGCSYQQRTSPPVEQHIVPIYALKDGKTVSVPYTTTSYEAAGAQEVITDPFVLQAHKVGQEVLFQVLAGNLGHAHPVLIDKKNSSEYLVTDSNALDDQLEHEGFAPYAFSTLTAAGATYVFEFSIPGQTDEEFVTVMTDEQNASGVYVTGSEPESVHAIPITPGQ